MVNKYFDGEISNPMIYDPVDEGLISRALATREKVEEKWTSLKSALP